METAENGILKTKKLSGSGYHAWKQKAKLILTFRQPEAHAGPKIQTPTSKLFSTSWKKAKENVKKLLISHW